MQRDKGWLRTFSVFMSLCLALGLSIAPTTAVTADWTPTDGPASTAGTSHRLIVELASPPLATWAATVTGASFPNGDLNVQAPASQNYVATLQAEQANFVNSLQAALPGATVSTFINELGAQEAASYQIAFNGLAIDPGGAGMAAARRALMQLPGVKSVYLDYAYHTTLYTSTTLINAPALYSNPAIGGRENAGEGIKLASMDGGIHHDAPMFSGEGYSYPPDFPPNGLGLTENNNGKIIASRVYFRAWDPPAAGEDTPWPGDSGTSHGVHTAGIAGGNVVTATYTGLPIPNVGGVANRAWLMSYRVFYNSVTGDGSFYTAEGLAALEDIVADGADVVNNSWGGGPGSAGGAFDALDTALINASNAGVFVSMSAGNAGPGNGTTDHPSPDYINVAATTSGGTLASALSIVAPEPISPTLQNMPFLPAAFGGALANETVFTYTLAAGAIISPTNFTGCDPWPAGTFTDQAALISRGVCEFGVKVLNAENAGAEFVVVYNNQGDDFISMGPGAVGISVTIPSVFVGQTDGEGMVNWVDAYGSASELAVDTHAVQVGNTPDVVIDFSSRGPGVGNVLKPDIAAPGVNILSQGYTPGATGEARHLGFGQVSGTSMASPHVAGSAALLRQIHPTWSNAYIKSALMSTSKYMDIYTEEGAPAQPLDMGAGRLDLTNAADPGLIFSPPSLSFGVVPTGTTDLIQVTLTSVAAASETYSLTTLYTGDSFTATTELPGFSVSPSAVTLGPGESTVITVTLDTAASAGLGDNQGYIIVDGPTHDGHLPAWARVTHATPLADVLVLDNDGSESVAFPDYQGYYTETLTALGYTFEVYDVDFNCCAGQTTLPDVTTLLAYEAILYFTGDYYYPNGSFTVPTGLTALDMDRLTEYANNGGVIIAMGQDIASVLDSTDPSSAYFFYGSVLGGSYLQDSVTGEVTPTLPIVPLADAPLAFQSLSIDVSGDGDGAANQFYIDEIQEEPIKDPDTPSALLPYQALLRYPGALNEETGVVAMAHRDQPTLERPGITYFGRSIYTTFGLEGVNNGLGTTEREELLATLLDWAMDEPEVTITNTTAGNPSNLATFEAALSSTLTTTTGVSYRWDFGDGTAFAGPYESEQVSHTYAVCGTYDVRVEATDSFGNKVIGTLTTAVGECTTHIMYLPIIHN